MPRCLVTGGAGFIGSHLVEGLLQNGEEVRVLDDLSTGYAANLDAVRRRIQFIQGSVTEPASTLEAARDCEVIYHLAAVPSVTKSVEDPRLIHDVCATGTLNMLEAARQAKVRRVIFAGSASAYGDQPGDRRTEDDLLLPLSPYAAAKLAGEHYAKAFTAVYGLETVRLRFFNVFGPRQDPRSPYSGVIALFIAAMTQGQKPTVLGDGLQSRDFVYVENVVGALMQTARAPAAIGNVYNIGSGTSTTILDLVACLNQLLGSRLEPSHAPPRPGDIRFSLADIARARRDLSYEPKISFLEGLRQTLASSRR